MTDRGSPAAKKTKTSNMSLSKIGTHNGTFHCDDALACWMLRQTSQFKDAEIVRSRTPEILDSCDIVVDVGAIFDHSKRRYDHHQREFKETFNSLVPAQPWKTKLSSAGLVYIFYGMEVVRSVMERNLGSGEVLSDEQVRVIYDKVYENLIEEIDAVDNGISSTNETPRYKVTTTLSSRVANLNPRWNEESSDGILLERFKKAMGIVSQEFVDRVTYLQLGWLAAHSAVKDAVMERYKVHKSGEIVTLGSTGMPWKDHISSLEEELEIKETIKYVLYEDKANNKWRIQCVPIRPDSFTNRLSLPAEWCGLRDDVLSKVADIPGCVFVHTNGFIGGHDTYEGVLAMASKTLEMAAAKQTE